MDSWAEFHSEIIARLNEARPPRSAREDHDWREPVYGWARNHIPNESNLVRFFAEQEVNAQETKATRQGNRYLRQWAKGERPLLWSDLGPLPVIVGKVRIRMDAVTADDIEDAAADIEADGKHVFDEVMLLARALRDLARSTRRGGLERVVMLGDLAPRYGDSEIAGWSEDDDDLPVDEDY